MKMLLDNCCGCVSLRNATVIISLIDIVRCFVLLSCQTLAATTGTYWTHFEYWCEVLFFVMEALGLVSAIVLALGAILRNKWLLVPWLVYTIFNLFVAVFVQIYIIIIPDTKHFFRNLVITIVLGLPILVLYIYFWVVIISYSVELENEKKTKGGDKEDPKQEDI